MFVLEGMVRSRHSACNDHLLIYAAFTAQFDSATLHTYIVHLGARYDDVIAGRHQRQLLQTHARIVCAGKRQSRLLCNLEDGNEHAAHCENSKQESDFRQRTSTFGSTRMVSGFVQSCPARNLTLRRHAEIQLRAVYR